MRKFRFVGDPETYNWDEKPIVGNVYPENHFGTNNGIPQEPLNSICDAENEAWIDNPEDWKEVFDLIHKDTDLGYFAGLAMQGIMSNQNAMPTQKIHFQNIAEDSIATAKELIKQLDEERNETKS